jgi:hypothetical protein
MRLRAAPPDEPGLLVGFVDEPGRNSRLPSLAAKAKRGRSGGLRTRECHSALNAMRRSRRKSQRDSIYPHYSGVRWSNGPSGFANRAKQTQNVE